MPELGEGSFLSRWWKAIAWTCTAIIMLGGAATVIVKADASIEPWKPATRGWTIEQLVAQAAPLRAQDDEIKKQAEETRALVRAVDKTLQIANNERDLKEVDDKIAKWKLELGKAATEALRELCRTQIGDLSAQREILVDKIRELRR